jgi:hypothetical protein
VTFRQEPLEARPLPGGDEDPRPGRGLRIRDPGHDPGRRGLVHESRDRLRRWTHRLGEAWFDVGDLRNPDDRQRRFPTREMKPERDDTDTHGDGNEPGVSPGAVSRRLLGQPGAQPREKLRRGVCSEGFPEVPLGLSDTGAFRLEKAPAGFARPEVGLGLARDRLAEGGVP